MELEELAEPDWLAAWSGEASPDPVEPPLVEACCLEEDDAWLDEYPWVDAYEL